MIIDEILVIIQQMLIPHIFIVPRTHVDHMSIFYQAVQTLVLLPVATATQIQYRDFRLTGKLDVQAGKLHIAKNLQRFLDVLYLLVQQFSLACRFQLILKIVQSILADFSD